MTDLFKVTYCGLYCGLCSRSKRTSVQARELRETLKHSGIEHWGPYSPDFEHFWRFLDRLIESELHCSCREETCDPPSCTIRKCAAAKGVDVCPFCKEYPCERIKDLADSYVMLLTDGKRMKSIGLDKWIKEQEERGATGFTYVDIRPEPYDFQDKLASKPDVSPDR